MCVLQIVTSFSENGLRFNLRASNFEIFSGEQPPDPLLKGMLYIQMALCIEDLLLK